ncbi:hypothetical protein F2P56_009233 [Juglans regia]|uniref:Protein FAR1-RELATED SEQUENCE n=1 Tax=Juglans regia TaxID=51240 RepID=A0A834D2I9_JUGRE|nr:hypothetical protein F2P56_009233 [Juglans regia]
MVVSAESEKHVGETSSDSNIELDADGTNEVSEDDERVEPPKSWMVFTTDKDVLAYYKRYVKQEGFGVITKRTKREVDGSAKYEMLFALFVGANHYGQSILLGACLISREDTSTFVWLFEVWLMCMNGRTPKAIITNKDWAMKNAIAIVFPNSCHRYCLWHIKRKLSEKLGSHKAYDIGLKMAIQSALYDTQSCEEFEEKWRQLLHKYNLTDNA